jgi:PilZ domain
MEPRQHERYVIQIPLSFSWRGTKGIRYRREGILRNISGGGVFVLTGNPPLEGTRIQFSVLLHSIFPGSKLSVRAVAQVIRVELAQPDEGCTGFAAAIKSFTLRNDETRLIVRTEELRRLREIRCIERQTS